MTFDERKKFMVKQGVREDRIQQCKNPAFAPVEVFKHYREPLAYIAVAGDKNRDRYMKSDFFEEYPTEKGAPIKFERIKDRLVPLNAKRGYFLLASPAAGGISGTDLRTSISSNGTEESKKSAFKRHIGEYDEELFKLLKAKLSGGVK